MKRSLVIIIMGLPGTGKSFFSQRLAKRIGAAYISSDRLRKEMFKERTYSETEKELVYEAMAEQMQKMIYSGSSVVLDGTFHSGEYRKLIKDRIPPPSVAIWIEIMADEEVAKKRLAQSRPYSEADYDVYRKIRALWEEPEEAYLRIRSANDNLEEMLSKAIDYINHSDERGTN